MNWARLILQIPQLIGIAMMAVEKIKGAAGPDNETAVIETMQESLPMVEATFDKDLVNDDAFKGLLSDYIKAKVALLNGLANAKALKPAADPT